jgi:Tol biopolymer transport system component
MQAHGGRSAKVRMRARARWVGVLAPALVLGLLTAFSVTPFGSGASAQAAVAPGDLIFEQHHDVPQSGVESDLVLLRGGSEKILTSGRDDQFPDVSPDGSEVLYTSTPISGGYRGIWVINSDGSGKTRLTAPDSSSLDASAHFADWAPRWSPDSKKIAFNRYGYQTASYTDDVFVMNADGSGLTDLTPNTPIGSANLDVTWSPDGTRLAFMRQSTAFQNQVWVMNSDGSNAHVVDPSATGCDDSSPDWSPDGRRIYVGHVCAGSDHVGYLTSTDGFAAQSNSSYATLVSGLTNNNQVRVSGNGSTLYYDDNAEIYSANTTTGTTALVANDAPAFGDVNATPVRASSTQGSVASGDIVFDRSSGANMYDELMLRKRSDGRVVDLGVVGAAPAVSPDGSRIAFINSDSYLSVMNLDGTGVKPIRIDNPVQHFVDFPGEPQWSPDGQWIAFVEQTPEADGSHYSVRRIKPDGSSMTVLADGIAGVTGVNFDPAWSPDGLKIVFSTDREAPGLMSYQIYIMNASDGSNQHRIEASNSGYNDTMPIWSPDRNRIYFWSARPGGGYLQYYTSTNGFNTGTVTISQVPGSNTVTTAGFRLSADGSAVAFQSGNAALCSSIFTLPTVGGTPTLLTGNDCSQSDTSPTFVPAVSSPKSISVTPSDGTPGTVFSASWRCDSSTGLSSLAATDGRALPDYDVGIIVDLGSGAYSREFQVDGDGAYQVSVDCNGAVSKATFTVTAKPYIALGDSFSSGEGASGYYPNTDIRDVNMCHRGLAAYSFFVASHTHLARDFAACSGAVIEDIHQFSQAFVGPKPPAVSNATTPPNHTPAGYPEIPMLDHVSRIGATRLVTLTIGGNNLGFPSVLTDCIRAVTHISAYGCKKRDDAGVQEAIGWLTTGRSPGCYNLPGLDPNTKTPEQICSNSRVPSLHETYEEIARRLAPGGKVVVASYPRLFGKEFTPYDYSPTGQVCQVGQALGFDANIASSDVNWLNAKGNDLNATISAEVAKAQADLAAAGVKTKVQFVNVDAGASSLFQSHRICDTGAPFFHALEFTGNSIRTLKPQPWSFHPNDDGQAAYGSAINAKM